MRPDPQRSLHIPVIISVYLSIHLTYAPILIERPHVSLLVSRFCEKCDYGIDYLSSWPLKSSCPHFFCWIY